VKVGFFIVVLMEKPLILVTGGARSGKSCFAQKLAEAVKGRKAFIATAEPLDHEMKQRITLHRKKRPAGWNTVEEPLHLEKMIKKCGEGYDVLLIDCLTLWISNLMVNKNMKEKAILKNISNLVTSCKEIPSRVIMVTNELGMGIVPANRLSRLYRDLVGKANQQIAAEADEVYFLVSGIPMKLKG
jgi:adenosylcobinamide kinase/adenosylcobinamide-phosphate guanylyltransferase